MSTFTKTAPGEYTLWGGDTEYIVCRRRGGWWLGEASPDQHHGPAWLDVGIYPTRGAAARDAVDRDNAAIRARVAARARTEHTLRGAGPVHAGNCPACRIENPPYAVDPRTEGYWQS